MPRLNPATGAATCSDARPDSTTVERHLLVAGGVVATFMVKIVLDGCVYITAEETKYEDGKGRSHLVKRGAVLVANHWLGHGQPLFCAYNNGIFDALRATGEHIPDTTAVEFENLEAASGSLEMVLALTWSVRKHSPPAERQDVRRLLLEFVQKWGRWQDDFKVEALRFAERAAEKTDVIPFPALSPMTWAAERRLGRRREKVTRIAGQIGRRQTALLLVFDQAWRFRGEVERELGSMLARFMPDGRFSTKSVPGMVRRLERLSIRCGLVSLAPFGRRTFSHVSKETAYAAQLLDHGNDAEAKVVMERSLRSLYLMVVKREIVEIMTVVLAMRRLKGEVATADLGSGIDYIRISLAPTLDCDFQQPVTAKVIAFLLDARNALASEPSRLDVVCAYLRQAQAPL